MKVPSIYQLAAAFMVLMMAGKTATAQQQFLLEAEDFQFKGGWITEQEGGKGYLNNQLLRVLSGKTPAVDAVTVISVKQAGSYAVWIRSADFPDNRPGTRLFRLQVNEQSLEEAGKHGKAGFYWEKVGQVVLQAGNAVLRLQDSRGNFGRCDAILFSQAEGFDPNTQTVQSLVALRVKPVPQKATQVKYPALSQAAVDPKAAATASITNEQVRLRFVSVNTTGAEKRLATKTAIRQKGRWIDMDEQREDHRIYIIRADNPQLSYGNFFPSWNGSIGMTAFTSNGKEYSILETDNTLNPFLAGQVTEAIPMAARQLNATTIEVNYTVGGEAILKGVWSIQPGSRHIALSLQFKPSRNGYYSMGVAAFQSMAADSVTNIQLPPMFQYKRLSPQPVLLPSGMMPQPVAIAEEKRGAGLFATFASGLAHTFPASDWGSASSSPMGFSIKNEVNRVQPVAFAPVMGLDDSKLTAGQTIQRDFAIGAIAGGWNEALEYISDSIYKVKDYRKQHTTSLTEAAFNMIDLVKQDAAAGWDAKLKGFYDIEANPAVVPTVVHAAPLAIISAAVLSKDEEFYLTRALPTIEYTLSRSGFRWAKAVSGTPFNSDKKSLQLSPYGSQFTTNYFEGLNALLGQANPWLTDIALPDGKIRSAKGYSVDVPAWSQELAAWRLTKDDKWLTAAQTNADQFIATQVNGNLTKPLSRLPFYNASFYAYWWDLADLYDATKEVRYLLAADASAYHTLIGIRAYPQVKDTLQTIHPGNAFEGNTTMWWKGDKKYRLGFPRVQGDAPEKQVPQALVSPVGLGFEQPFTYFSPANTVRPVFMSSWAPHLLRLYQYNHKKIFETYARNAVIGRFTNYPGYYATGFTDITMRPDFPYKGPDVSSIYYHHIPPHLAFTLDYVITEAMQRSNGKVQFPYGKQDGFVWFNNRVFGGGKGIIMDDKKVSLWMKKGLITIDNPEVNYVTAISDDRFWILLTNEASVTAQANISVAKEVPVADQVNASQYSTPAAKKGNLALNKRTTSLSIPAKGFMALSIPLASRPVSAVLPPVANGMKVIDLGAPWGKCYVFRIRSPFGWDSMYGYIEAGPIEGATLTATLNGKSIAQSTYPYEWSFYKLAANEPVKGELQLKTADGKTKEVSIEFE
jgi:hypothetical protein